MDQPLASTYRRSAILTAAGLLGLCLGLNLLVDPLWHFSGNRLSGQNMGFNERLSKLNRAARVVAGKDCVIYGSSRATLLDPSLFPDRDCYNMAVSEGLSAEFPYYARFLMGQGLAARTVILGADDLSFFSGGEENLPAWLRAGESQPRWWQDYLSLDALEFSIRALAGNSPRPRYYREDFSIAIEDEARAYRPDPANLVPVGQGTNPPARIPNPDFLADYRRLLAMHSEATALIYIPPISLWRLGAMIRRGELEAYLDSIHALSVLGRPVLDFSVPSAITADPTLTYDGSHYSLGVNGRIAEALRRQACGPCLRVDALSRDEYRARFVAAYQARVEQVAGP